MDSLNGGPHRNERHILGHVATQLSDTVKSADLATDVQKLTDESELQLSWPRNISTPLDMFGVEGCLGHEELRRENIKIFDFFWQRTTIEGDKDAFDEGKAQEVLHMCIQKISGHEQRCSLHSAESVSSDGPVGLMLRRTQETRHWGLKFFSNASNKSTALPQGSVNVEDDTSSPDVLVLVVGTYQRRSGSLPKRRSIERIKPSGTMTVCLGMVNGVSRPP